MRPVSCHDSLSMPSEGYDNLLRENGNPAARDLSPDWGSSQCSENERVTVTLMRLLTSNKISSTKIHPFYYRINLD
jgi:hypothetical protein